MTNALPPMHTDWNDAYINAAYIPDGASFPTRWAEQAAAFRAAMAAAGRNDLDIAYGSHARQRYDLFQPEGAARGLVVFVHGGYWKAFDKSLWSHLAAGPLAHGYAVAMPSYVLCPDARIGAITVQIGQAIAAAAARVAGPIVVAGHSAGGHLAARMLCTDSPLKPATLARVRRVLPISGVFDLRPLLRTDMNGIFGLDLDEARRESPALLEPLPGHAITCWVGAAERPEFVRQTALLANAWAGFDVTMTHVVEAGRHHFDVIAGLERADHPLTLALFQERAAS
jgi:arylformamidase